MSSQGRLFISQPFSRSGFIYSAAVQNRSVNYWLTITKIVHKPDTLTANCICANILLPSKSSNRHESLGLEFHSKLERSLSSTDLQSHQPDNAAIDILLENVFPWTLVPLGICPHLPPFINESASKYLFPALKENNTITLTLYKLSVLLLLFIYAILI